jgi:amidohydrolase
MRALAVALCCFGSALAQAKPAATDLDAEIARAAEAMRDRLVALRRDLHMHPELSNREERTARVVAERMRALGLDVRTGVARHGVVARLRGGRPGPTVALRADMDALPIDETLDVPYRSQTKNVKHACGHDAHTAILVGVAEALTPLRARLAGDVLFIFQPAEEQPPPGERGGAAVVVEEGGLGTPLPRAIFGLHVMPTIEVGSIGLLSGPAMASSDRLHVVVRGKGAHGAPPHEGIDTSPTAAEIVGALQTVRSRRVAPDEPFVLTIGRIEGGKRWNIVADEVVLDGTLRALAPEVRRRMLDETRRIVEGVAAAHGARAALEVDDLASPVINDATLATKARPVLARIVGEARVVTPRPYLIAEDFSAYQKVVPGLFLFLGVRNAARGITAPNHTAEFDLDEAALPIGVRALAGLAIATLAESR